ncbi:Dihydroorotate dehydrogenase (quinone), mitochondrial [Knufia fluminis]|uniref:Dihydroorotate dehydrogenase (quinone), mitochondrial n=1 Tax=Knufia fluminis TaxID=191047 RepID=A0AAN8EW26_9EURO|nr:Dihydroorotate dehydrogenase (quinone), mitochondrial [Knufia fluminis]
MVVGLRVAPRATNSILRSFRHTTSRVSQPSSMLRASQRSQSIKQFRRHASSVSTTGAAGSRVYNFFYGTTLILGLGVIYFYVTDTRASVHRWVVIPALRWAYKDPEEAHEVGNRALEQLWTFGMHPRERGDPDQTGDLAVEVFGQILRNPMGTSAGIDKHADIPDPLFAIGPAIIELGGTTPQPQSGNDKPRVFRLTSQNALINRYGLNSEGADHVAQRLRHRVRHFAERCGLGHDAQGETLVLDGHAGVPPGSLTPGKMLAVNIAKNKATPENDIEAIRKDYLYCAERLAPYADILVVNVSSPNTPGLRGLQNQELLTKILSSVVTAARSVQRTTKPAVMVKVSPDEDSDSQVSGICQAIWDSDVDGIIVGNTTNKRPESMPHLKNLTPMEEQHLLESGGFSGPHLFEKTVSMVKKYKKLLGDSPPRSDKSSPPSRSPGSVSEVAQEIKGNLAGSPANNRVEHSVQTGTIPTKNVAEKPDSEKKPLINLPTNKFYDQPRSEQDKLRSSPDGPESKQPPTEEQEKLRKNTLAAESKQPQTSEESRKSPDLARRDQPKVIFATGGITNGKQALEVLNAGASVAMVYTALVYGGVGTISRIKDEMRKELTSGKEKKQAKTASK